MSSSAQGQCSVEEVGAAGLGPCAGGLASGELRLGKPLVLAVSIGRKSARGVAVDPSTKAPIAHAPILCDDGPCGCDADGLWPTVTTEAKGRFEVRDLLTLTPPSAAPRPSSPASAGATGPS